MNQTNTIGASDFFNRIGSKADAQLSLILIAEDVGNDRAMQGARLFGIFKNAVAPA